MQHINSSSELKNAILLLEVDQAIDLQLLKNQVHHLYESFKPVNMLTKSLIPSSIIDTIIDSTIGLATGYISKKIVVGTSGNLFRKVIGSVIQLSVTTIIAKHPETIKSVGKFIFNQISRKINTNNRDR